MEGVSTLTLTVGFQISRVNLRNTADANERIILVIGFFPLDLLYNTGNNGAFQNNRKFNFSSVQASL